MVCFNFIKRLFLGESVHPDYVSKVGRMVFYILRNFRGFFPLFKKKKNAADIECTTSEYSCENESGTLLKAKKVIKYVWFNSYRCIVNRSR